MTYITLFGLQLFMAARSSSAIIKSVAGLCFQSLQLWGAHHMERFFYEEENSALKVDCFLFST